MPKLVGNIGALEQTPAGHYSGAGTTGYADCRVYSPYAVMGATCGAGSTSDVAQCGACMPGYYGNCSVCSLCQTGEWCLNGANNLCPLGSSSPPNSSRPVQRQFLCIF